MNRVENKRHTTLLCPHNKVGIIPCGYAKIDTYAAVAQSAEYWPSKPGVAGSLPVCRSIKSERGCNLTRLARLKRALEPRTYIPPEAPGLCDTTAAEYRNLDYKAERVAASRGRNIVICWFSSVSESATLIKWRC